MLLVKFHSLSDPRHYRELLKVSRGSTVEPIPFEANRLGSAPHSLLVKGADTSSRRRVHPPMAFAQPPTGLPLSGKRPLFVPRQSFVQPLRAPRMIAPAARKMHIHTPLVPSQVLSTRAGRQILLKLDNLQPAGSFKIRGHGHLCVTAASNGVRHFISSSGGNAGAAVAHAGQALGVPVTIVVPSSTPEFMISRLRACDASVIVHGSVWDESDRHARDLVETEPPGRAIHISPFDHPLLWAGHASLVEELKDDLAGQTPAAIVVSVGGGGLFLGVAEGARRVGWGEVPIITAETEGAASFAAMVAAGGEVVRLKEIASVAKSLGALAVSQRCAEWVREGRKVLPLIVSDREAVEACSLLAVQHRVLVEPACGAAVAAVVNRPARLAGIRDGPIVVVVCGGNMVSPALLDGWIKATGATEAVL